MAEEIENSVESEEVVDTPVAGIVDAINDEPDPKLEGLDAVTDDAGAPVAEVTDTDTDEAEEVPTGATPEKGLTLPASHVRSLKAYGWSDAEIKQNLEVMGDKFLVTAARIHKNRNDEVTSWADAGRKARQVQQNPPQKAAVEAASDNLKPIDIKYLKTKYGEHELIESLENHNKLLEEFRKITPIIQQSQQRAQQAELETVGREIEAFFGSKELEPYRDTYGTAKTMTEEQIAERNKVLETADALRVGARVQGRELPLDSALQLALDSVSSGLKTQVARNQIKEGLKTRDRAITLKPSSKGARPASAKPRNRGELEKKVGTALASIFPES